MNMIYVAYGAVIRLDLNTHAGDGKMLVEVARQRQCLSFPV